MPLSEGNDIKRRGHDPHSQDSSNALIELGVKTGLSLLFNILKINWLQNPCKIIKR